MSGVGNALGNIAKVAVPVAAAYFTGGLSAGLGTVASGAIMGATAGALSTAINGGSVLQGALAGGITGGAGGALMGYATGTPLFGAAASVGDVAASLQASNPTLYPTLGDAMTQAEALVAQGQTPAQILQGMGQALPVAGTTYNAQGVAMTPAPTFGQQLAGQIVGANPNAAGASAVGQGTIGAVTATPQGGGTAVAGASDWSTWAQGLLTPKNLMSIGSGLYGLYQSGQVANQNKQLVASANPWGTSGGFALAGQQLQDLMNNPTQVAANDPAYKLRIQGAQRATAGYGQDSGAASVAGANASTDWFNTRLQALGSLAGTQFSPATASQLGMQGSQNVNTMQSQSLASIGYGTTPGMNTSGGTNPALQAALLRLAGG